MSLRRWILGAALSGLAAAGLGCMDPSPGSYRTLEGELPGVSEGQEAEAVRASLGSPDSEASGWWSSDHTFNIEYRVWYYRDRGRVVFTPDTLVVVTSEADATEDGRPN